MCRGSSKSIRGAAQGRSTPLSASNPSLAYPTSLKIMLPARNSTQTWTVTRVNEFTKLLDSEPEDTPARPASSQLGLPDTPESIPLPPEIQPAEYDEVIVITPPPSARKPCPPKNCQKNGHLQLHWTWWIILGLLALIPIWTRLSRLSLPRSLKNYGNKQGDTNAQRYVIAISHIPILNFDAEIILLIPQVSSDCKKHKKLAGSITYNEALVIRKTATCLGLLEVAWAAWPSISRSTKQCEKPWKGFFFSTWWPLKKAKIAFPS